MWAVVQKLLRRGERADLYRSVLDQALDAVVSINEKNEVTFFNAAAERLWGYPRAEVLGRNVKMLVPEAIRPTHDGLVDANRTTGRDKIVGTSRDVQIFRKDGSSVWGNLSLSKVRLDGKILYTAFVKDITAEREGREIINQTLEQALDAVVTINERNEVTFFNAAAERLWGYPRAEVLGRNVKMLVPEAIRPTHDGLVDANRTTGRDKIVGTSRDVQIFRKDGSSVWGNLSLSKVRLDGKILYTAFVKDITAEREGREIINQTLEQALDAVVTINEKNEVTFFNAAAERLWGYPRAEVLGRNVKMLVPEAIRPTHDGLVDANRTTGRDKIVGTSREIRIERADGGVLWGKLSLSKVRLDGKILYTAFVQDVTAEVERREQVRMLSLVADGTDNSVIITDAKGHIDYVNAGFTRMTGYTIEEVAGRKPGSFLQGKHTDKATVTRIREHLRRQEAFYEEILNYDRNQRPYWISMAVNPVLGPDGKLERFIAIQANITATKQRALEHDVRLDAISKANAVLEWEADGAPARGNAVLASLLGVEDNDVAARLPRLDNALPADLLQHFSKGESMGLELRLANANGEPVWLAGAVYPLRDSEQRLYRWVMYATDATERRRAIGKAREALTEVLKINGNVSGIVSTINRIAQQTHLLSLNAAVEAARAGQSGRGFAVVAEEVRRLAQGSGDASRDITELVASSQARVKEIVARFEER